MDFLLEPTEIFDGYYSLHECSTTQLGFCRYCVVEKREQSSERRQACYDLLISLYGTVCYLCLEDIDLFAPRSPHASGWEAGLQLDHVIPYSKGGRDDIFNARPVHALCNLKKSSSPLIKKD